MKLQRGFVVLPRLRAKRPGSGARLFSRVRRSVLALVSGVNRARAFAAGILVGFGIWTPVFAALNDEPNPWVSATSLVFLGLAAISARHAD
jgi:hypothetical protein